MLTPVEDGKTEKVQKILSRAGVASRRAAETLILDGRVTVNGTVTSTGDRALAGHDVIAVDGITVQPDPDLKYFALNKPQGVISTASDPQGRPTVLDLLSDEPCSGVRVFPVGRLDMDSTGLMLLTNDGFLAHRLMHPKFGAPREYIVEVTPVPSGKDLKTLRGGLTLEDGDTGPARVSLLGKSGDRGQIKMIIHAGKKRQIRRSFEYMGYHVITLNRVRIGSLSLGNLKPGQARELLAPEVRELYGQTGI
ncbi:MAG: pseudouridine synthase [Candidatus Anoxymicrobium japonicum]|uniref:Pseudouridine synthase n=1 Tax=Candidatus Anoxymicrobium japonicum TaxID=2013648 RepID=A0A2N3G5M5_9ACTN|nr:MAG: pseudouridine synthase [Candidatus Anoxymicrobium japonicum]